MYLIKLYKLLIIVIKIQILCLVPTRPSLSDIIRLKY